MLLAGARERERTHRLGDRRELLPGAPQHLHVDLILEVGGGRADLARELDDAARFGEVARERLLADHAAELRAVSDCLRDLFHHGHAAEVRAEDRDHVDVVRHLPHAVEHLAGTQPAGTHRFGERVRRRARRQPVDLDAADGFERAQVELTDEAGADDPVPQRHASRRTCSRAGRRAAARARSQVVSRSTA